MGFPKLKSCMFFFSQFSPKMYHGSKAMVFFLTLLLTCARRLRRGAGLSIGLHQVEVRILQKSLSSKAANEWKHQTSPFPQFPYVCERRGGDVFPEINTHSNFYDRPQDFQSHFI